MSYVTFFANQHIDRIQKAVKYKDDSECIQHIAKTLNKSIPGYYIIFEMCDDQKYGVSLFLVKFHNILSNIDNNAVVSTIICCYY